MGNRRARFVLLTAIALLLVLPASGHAVSLQVFHVTSADSGLRHIVAGPDGALWFTERKANQVGRITTSGQITEYPIPNNASGLDDTGPDEIVRGRDGALWFLADIGESVYRMTTDGNYAQVYFDQLNVVGRIPVGRSLFGSAPTQRAPTVSLVLPAARTSKLRHSRSLPIVCTLAAAGRCSVTASLSPASARRLGLKASPGAKALALARGASTLKRAGRATIRLALSTRVLSALGRVHRGLRLTITATSTATGATPRTSTRTLLLRP